MYTSVFERVYKEEGRMEGRVEGRMEGQAELVRTMLSEGMPAEEVSRYTKLPREEVARFSNRYSESK
jgi:predicted transposase/invertase (TIGR01784 family)